MITSPLLSKVRHREMITLVSPPLTTLIHVSRVVGQFIVRLKLISKWEPPIGLNFKSNVFVQIHCFKQHSIRYELCFKKYLAA